MDLQEMTKKPLRLHYKPVQHKAVHKPVLIVSTHKVVKLVYKGT